MAKAKITFGEYESHVESIVDLYDDFLVCRTIGHSWDDNPGASFVTIFNWALPLRCTRCSSERIDYLNLAGEVMSRRYIYPDGYKVAGTRQGDRVGRLQARQEMMRRRIIARRRVRRAA